MATEVLKAISRRQPLQYGVQHDLESFIWVLAYAIRRHLCHNKSPESSKVVSFQEHFGMSDITSIFASRKAGLPLDFGEDIPESLLSTNMRQLFMVFEVLVEKNNSVWNLIPLTYDSIITALDDAIVSLEA